MKHIFGIKTISWLMTLAFTSTVVIMAIATAVFLVNGCSTNNLDRDSVQIKAYNGEIVIKHHHDTTINRDGREYIEKTSFDSVLNTIDSLNSVIKANQQIILKRQDDLVNDMRQETNNNLDKIAAWLSFWIAVLAILGIVVPLAYQIKVHQDNKEEANDLIEKYKRSIEEFDFHQKSHELKMLSIAFCQGRDNRLIEEKTEEVKQMYLRNLCDKYSQYIRHLDGIIQKDNWYEVKTHLYSVLVNLDQFLRKFKECSTLPQSRRIQIARDSIRLALEKIGISDEFSDIKNILTKINANLSSI